MRRGVLWLDRADRDRRQRRARHHVIRTNMFGQRFSRTMKAALLDCGLNCGEVDFPRIICDGRRSGDRIDRHAADACDTLQLPFYPLSAEDREQVADFKRASRHCR